MRGHNTHSWGNKGVVLTTWLLILLTLGLANAGLFAAYGADAINQRLEIFGDFDDPSTLETIATFQNSNVASIQELDIQNGSSYENRMLYPLESEEINVQVGLFVVHWANIHNAIDGRNWTQIRDGPLNDRAFFIGINSNVSAVDPANDTHCVEDAEEEGYMCAWSFTTQDKLAPGGVLHEVDFSSSSTGHDRTFDIVSITPKATFTTTSDDIISFYYGQSQIMAALAMDIFVGIYYFIIVGLALGGILLIFVTLRKIYFWVKSGGKDNAR